MHKNIFTHKILQFMVELRTENRLNEELYRNILDHITETRLEWKTQGYIPLSIFEACIDLIHGTSGGNRFLSEPEQVKLEDLSNELYHILMGFDNA